MITLYNVPVSSYGAKVRIILNHKGRDSLLRVSQLFMSSCSGSCMKQITPDLYGR